MKQLRKNHGSLIIFCYCWKEELLKNVDIKQYKMIEIAIRENVQEAKEKGNEIWRHINSIGKYRWKTTNKFVTNDGKTGKKSRTPGKYALNNFYKFHKRKICLGVVSQIFIQKTNVSLLLIRSTYVMYYEQ